MTDIHHSIDIPVKSDTTDLKLYRYQYQNLHKPKQNVTLVEVPDQKFDPKTKTIHAEFDGGDTFVVLSGKEVNDVLPKKADSIKTKLTKSGKIKGLPNLSINPSDVSKDGVWSIKKEITYKSKKKSLKVDYKVQKVESEDGVEYVSITPSASESGLTPLLLLHGYRALGFFGGTSESVGFTNDWDQDGENYSEAEVDVPSSHTFSGNTYTSGTQLNYDNPDTQFITGTIPIDDGISPGQGLTDLSLIGMEGYTDYTKNYDLFMFEYDSDDENIHYNSSYLNNYIQNLRNIGKLSATERVNIAAHSMGGLVSRYFIENIDEEADNDIDVSTLITIGTPNFGLGLYSGLGGDMDRESSCLWNGGNLDTGCEELANVHDSTVYYVGFAGIEEVEEAEGVTNYYSAPDYWSIPSSYLSYFEDYFNLTDVLGGLDDGYVNIDSALGSQYDIGQITPVEYNERWVITGKLSGHSAMLADTNLVQQLIAYYGMTW